MVHSSFHRLLSLIIFADHLLWFSFISGFLLSLVFSVHF